MGYAEKADEKRFHNLWDIALWPQPLRKSPLTNAALTSAIKLKRKLKQNHHGLFYFSFVSVLFQTQEPLKHALLY